MFDFEMVLQLVGMVAFILAGVVLLYLMPYLQAKLGDAKLRELWKMVCIAVQAAEQLFGPGKGVDKKAYVEETLVAQGVEIGEAVNNMIEAAVYDLT